MSLPASIYLSDMRDGRPVRFLLSGRSGAYTVEIETGYMSDGVRAIETFSFREDRDTRAAYFLRTYMSRGYVQTGRA